MIFTPEVINLLMGSVNESLLLERLSSLEHDQWMNWAKTILKTENISKERAERWEECFVPYSNLTEEMKEYDREYARKVIDLLMGKV